MISKERMEQFIEYSKSVSSFSKWNIDIKLQHFDFEKFEKAYEIYKNKDNYDEKMWSELYNKYKDDCLMVAVLFAYHDYEHLTHPEIIGDVLKKILEMGHKRNPTIPQYSVLEESFASECLLYPLSDDSFKVLLDIVPLKHLINVHFDIAHHPEELQRLKSMPDSNKDKMALACFNRIKKYGFSSDSRVDKLTDTLPIAWTKNMDILNNMIDEIMANRNPDLEPVASTIISSEVLNHEDPAVQMLFKDAFDCCDSYYLTKYPKFLASDISIREHGKIKDHLDDNCNLTNYSFTDATGVKHSIYGELFDSKIVIEKLCKEGLIDSSVETDLAHRIINGKIRELHELAVTLFSHTSDPTLIPLIDKLLSYNKIEAYKNNPYIPAEMLIKRAESFCEQIDKLINKGKDENIKEVWYSHISDMAKKTTLSDKCYNTILNCVDAKHFLMEIASYKTTPINVLKELVKKSDEVMKDEDYNTYTSWKYETDKVSAIAKMNILCRENNLNPKIVDYFTVAARTYLFYSKSSDNNATHNTDAVYGRNKVEKIAKEFPEETNKILELLKEFSKQEFCSEDEQKFFQRLKYILTNAIEEQKNEQSPSNHVALHKLSNEMYNVLCDFDMYVKLPSIIDEFDKCFSVEYDKSTEKENIESDKSEMEQEL